MKQVVIVGGGFAGVAAVLALQKKHLPDAKIILIDQNSFHVFTPSLYEVATSEEPQQNISFPFDQIVNSSVQIITEKVVKVDIAKQQVLFEKQDPLSFDYLIFAVGSEPSYMGIKGLEQYGLPLKNVADAEKIKDQIKNLCCKEGACNKKVQVVIGGGGFSGTELAAEMIMYKDHLAKQNHLASDCLEVSIIQGSDRLLKELDSHVSDIAQKRIEGPQVKFCFGGHITEVTKDTILTDDNKTYPYDIFIWTGGVTANTLARTSLFPVTSHGQVIVNDYLQIQDHPNMFAVGDVAGFLDPKTQKPVPNVAQVAEEQGKVAGDNVVKMLQGNTLEKYHYRHFGYIVPLRGRFAAAELGSFHMDGFFGWVFQQLVVFRYLLGIFSLPKALKRWNKFEENLDQ